MNTLTVTRDQPDLRFEFTKTFVPPELQISLNSVTGACMLGRWRLVPDVPRILEGLQAGAAPDWLAVRPIGAQPRATVPASAITFGDAVDVLELRLPEVGKTADRNLYCAMRVSRPIRNFEELFAFLHVIDDQGEVVAVSDFPVWRAVACENALYPIPNNLPSDLPSGRYTIWLGIYNPRTGKRLAVTKPGAATVDDDCVLMGSFQRTP